MTITRDHVSDLAEKPSRSGKTSPSATATATAASHVPRSRSRSRNVELARDSNRRGEEGPDPVVTLATLRSLPENEEVTLYLDVVPAAPPGTKKPKAAKKPSKKVAKVSEFDRFLERPCPDLGGLLHTLEKKITSSPRGQRQSSRTKPRVAAAAEEEVVATVSQCVIVRRISRGNDEGGVCAIKGTCPNLSTPPMPPPPPAVPPRTSPASKVDATINACLLGESQTDGENLDRCVLDLDRPLCSSAFPKAG